MKKDTLEKTAVLVGSFALLAGLLKVRAQEQLCGTGEACAGCEALCQITSEGCSGCDTLCQTTSEVYIECGSSCEVCEACEICENCENAEVPPVSLPPASVKRVSKVISFSKTIDGSYEIMREDTSGAIKELLFVSPSDNYKVRIVLDGDTAYDDSFSDLASISQSLNDVAAYSSGGNYYLNILNLYYLKSCTVIIETFESIAFSKLYIKYEVLEYA